MADDSIRRTGLRKCLPHRIFAHQPKHDPDRSDQSVEHDAEQDSGIDPPKHMSNPHPSLMNWRKKAWKKTAEHHKQSSADHGPRAERLSVKQHRPQTDDAKHSANQESKTSQFFGAGFMIHSLPLRTQSSSNSFFQSESPSKGF